MKYKIVLILIQFIQISLFAQKNENTYVVHYSYSTYINDFSYNIDSSLIFDNNTSVYEMDHTNSFEKNKQNKGSDIILQVKPKGNDFVYKDFNTGAMYFTDIINAFQPFYIKDSLNVMEWELNEKFDVILGYTCQEATSSYGGRTYRAYFTSEIPIPNGPWRFHGLPGLILKVESIDSAFKLEATSLEVKNKKFKISNPYQDRDFISWEFFLKLYKRTYDEVRRNSMQSWGPSQTIPKMRIVEYIKD